jgi:hypothetical protein
MDREQVYRRWSALCFVLIAIGCAVGIAVPAGVGWDFANFYDAGRRIAAGQAADLYDPLSPIAGQPPQGRTGFFGAPLSAVFYLPLAWFDAWTALVVFKMQNVLAYAVAFLVLFRFSLAFVTGGQLERSKFAARSALFCLLFQPFWTVFRVGGQTTPTVLMCLAIGLVLHTRGLLWGSAIAVVIAALIKPALAPAILVLAAVSGLAFGWRLTATLAVTGLLSLALVGWPAHAAFLDLMGKTTGLTWPWYFNSSIYVLPETLRQYAGPAALLWVHLALSMSIWALKGTVVVGTLGLVLLSRGRPWTAAAHRHFHFLLSVVFFLLWSPTVWEHYLALLFLPLTYVLAAGAHFSRQARGIVAAILITSIAQNLILINWVRDRMVFDSLPELIAAAMVKSVPLLLTMVLLARHRGEWFESYAAPAWKRFEVRAASPN